MAEFINHNSFILFSVIVILIAGGIVLRRGVEIKRVAPLWRTGGFNHSGILRV